MVSSFASRLYFSLSFSHSKPSVAMKRLFLRGTALVGLFNIQLPALSVFVTPVAAADKCQPYVWGDPSHGFAIQAADDDDSPPPKVGEVNCRQKDTSPGSVNYYTCTQMADKHDINVERFFLINPNLKKDCSNIQPKTKYCVDGCKHSSCTL